MLTKNTIIYIAISALLLFLFPFFISRAEVAEEEIFDAKVLEILEEKEIAQEDGSKTLQQNIKLKATSGTRKGEEFIVFGISEIEIIGGNVYKKGDKVLVNYAKDLSGADVFYITDYVRRGSLYLLAFIFSLIIIAIGKWKGLKALLGLIISFAVIMKFIVPQILNGANPVFIGVVGSFIILIFIIYITEGFNWKSHLAIASILIALIITSLISIGFSSLAQLGGMAQEEAMFLVSLGEGSINFKGLLLAAILIGTLGVLDDVVISQIEAVAQIKEANPNLSPSKVFVHAFSIGATHLGALTNTLFLAYAGASLPLILLFSLKQPPFLTFSQVINNEIVATEIVRTLAGNIGLALALPISTYLAAYYYKNANIKNQNAK